MDTKRVRPVVVAGDLAWHDATMSIGLRSRIPWLLLLASCASSPTPPPAEPAPVATQGGAAQIAATPASSAELPEYPTRDHIAQVLRGLAVHVAACVTSPGPRDQVSVAFAIASDGHVAEVSFAAPTPFDGTSEGVCILETVRQATFLPFRRERFTVNFPFRVRP